MKKLLYFLFLILMPYNGYAVTKSVPIDKLEIADNDLPQIALANINDPACELYLTINNVGTPFKTSPNSELVFIINYIDTVRLFRKSFESEAHEIPLTRKGKKVQMFMSVFIYDVPDIKKLTRGGITKVAIQAADGSFVNYDISMGYQMTLPNEIKSLYTSLLSENSSSDTTNKENGKNWFPVWGLWLIAFAIICLFFIARKTNGKENASALQKDGLQFPKAKSYNVTISVTTDKDGYEYSIKGINYCNIDDSMLGDFFGTARALRSNTHDPYAIGVYRGNKRVGFLPRGNSELHAQIMAAGGSVDIEGYIAKATEDGHTFYYGKVNLL